MLHEYVCMSTNLHQRSVLCLYCMNMYVCICIVVHVHACRYIHEDTLMNYLRMTLMMMAFVSIYTNLFVLCVYVYLHTYVDVHVDIDVNIHVHSSRRLDLVVQKKTTQITRLLYLKENSFSRTIGYAGSRLPTCNIKIGIHFFLFRNCPDAYLSNPTNPRLTHRTSHVDVNIFV